MSTIETLEVPAPPLATFLAVLRADRAKLLALGDPLSISLALARDEALIAESRVREALALLSHDMRDYAISSAYALLIGPARRKSLSAYFTPPSLATATIEAARPFFERPGATVLDPACGGGSFLVPTARAMIFHGVASGDGLKQIASDAVARIKGIELDAGLASLSGTLLADALRRDFDITVDTACVVETANALETNVDERFDLIIGNPPYSKVWAKGAAAISAIAGKADLGGHTNLYALFVLRALGWLKPGGGLAFVLPTSFIAGPYFKGFREEILARANVIRIDMHQQREHLFIDAIQDVCLLVLQRHGGDCVPSDCYALGLIDADGRRTDLGTASTQPKGEAWLVPVASGPRSATGHFALTTSKPADVIASYGYRVRVGKVVPKRERSHLFSEPGPDRIPVLWASDVRADGLFRFQGGTRTALSAWYRPPSSGRLDYVSRGRSVIVQRTANRDQKRRLNASAVSEAFATAHAEHGYVAENHVIVIEPAMAEPLVSPDTLAALLNSAIVSERFSAVAGSFSVSAKLLARLALPPASDLPAMGPKFDGELAGCFAGLDGILAGVATPE